MITLNECRMRLWEPDELRQMTDDDLMIAQRGFYGPGDLETEETVRDYTVIVREMLRRGKVRGAERRAGLDLRADVRLTDVAPRIGQRDAWQTLKVTDDDSTGVYLVGATGVGTAQVQVSCTSLGRSQACS